MFNDHQITLVVTQIGIHGLRQLPYIYIYIMLLLKMSLGPRDG